MPLENTMRSELIFRAMGQVANRYLLVNIAAKATRKLHRPNTRVQETMDDVLMRFSHVNPMARSQEKGSAKPLHRVEKVQTHSRSAQRSQAVA
jgi:hypothetical protein